MDMEVTDEQRDKFPSPTEGGILIQEQLSAESESESDMEVDSGEELNCLNNNATAKVKRSEPLSTEGSATMCHSQGRCHDDIEKVLDRRQTALWETNIKNDGLMQSIVVMQKFMLKQGLINKPINEAEVLELLQTYLEVTAGTSQNIAATDKGKGSNTDGQRKSIIPKPKIKSKNLPSERTNCFKSVTSCESEVTIYKKAVQQVAPDLDVQIEQFICNVRRSAEDKNNKANSSSEELMDTSDESNDPALITANCISGAVTIPNRGQPIVDVGPGRSNDPRLGSQVVTGGQADPVQFEQAAADEFLKEAERAKAKLYDVPGN